MKNYQDRFSTHVEQTNKCALIHSSNLSQVLQKNDIILTTCWKWYRQSLPNSSINSPSYSLNCVRDHCKHGMGWVLSFAMEIVFMVFYLHGQILNINMSISLCYLLEIYHILIKNLYKLHIKVRIITYLWQIYCKLSSIYRIYSPMRPTSLIYMLSVAFLWAGMSLWSIYRVDRKSVV